MKRVTAWMSTVRPGDAIAMTSFGIVVSIRFGGALRFFAAADVSSAPSFGATTTLLLPCGVPVNAERREPGVLRQRAADLVHDVRPDVAVFVEAAG